MVVAQAFSPESFPQQLHATGHDIVENFLLLFLFDHGARLLLGLFGGANGLSSHPGADQYMAGLNLFFRFTFLCFGFLSSSLIM